MLLSGRRGTGRKRRTGGGTVLRRRFPFISSDIDLESRSGVRVFLHLKLPRQHRRNPVGNTRHPGIIDDYAKTFRVLKELRPDVFLAQHGRLYGMEEKMRRLQTGAGGNPFIDPEGYRKFVAAQEAAYLKQLAEERSGAQ